MAPTALPSGLDAIVELALAHDQNLAAIVLCEQQLRTFESKVVWHRTQRTAQSARHRTCSNARQAAWTEPVPATTRATSLSSLIDEPVDAWEVLSAYTDTWRLYLGTVGRQTSTAHTAAQTRTREALLGQLPLLDLNRPPARPHTAFLQPRSSPEFEGQLARLAAENKARQTIHQFLRTVVGAASEAEIIHLARRIVPSLIPTPRSSLVLLSRDGQTMVGQPLQGPTAAPRTFSVSVETNVWRCIESKQVLVIENTATSALADARWAHRNGWGSLLNAPILADGVVIGTLNFSRQAPSGFSPLDRMLATELAASLGQALKIVRKRISNTEAREAAEAQERLKDQFLAVLAHELRTPLHAIVGMSDLLSADGLDPKRRELVTAIRSGGVVLSSLVDNVLDYSKLELGRLELQEELVDLEAVARDVVNVMRPRATTKGLALQLQVDLPKPMLRTDPGRFRQVVLNLVQNAIKFTSAGSIDVALTSADGNRVFVSVTDSGVGVPPAMQEQIFTPFQRVDSSVTRATDGTGLGLAICRQLCEAMGGWIRVDSEENAGSTFSFTVGGTLEPRPAPKSNQPADLPSLRILVVDDNPVNRQVVRTMLHHLGLSCDLADGGRSARALYARNRYDLVLVDLHMPDEDGISLARALLATPASSAVFVTMTADAQPTTRPRCLAAGMVDVLFKPTRLPTLRQTLLRVRPAHDGKPATWMAG